MLSPLWLLILVTLTVCGIWSADPLLTLVTVLGLLLTASLLLWQRCCLAGVHYVRRLSAERVLFGETVEFAAEVSNLKPLPLTWLRVEDTVPAGLRLDATMTPGLGLPDRLLLLFAMLPYQRVVRRMRLHCNRRGEHVFGPATLESGDYLDALSDRASRPGTDRLIVYPKVFPIELRGLAANQILGRSGVRRHLLTDPIRIIGTRDYQAGDPYRAIDWRATARRDRLMVRLLQPSTTPILDIVLNFLTPTQGWSEQETDALEFALSIAASLAVHGAARGWAVGLRGNGSSAGVPLACAATAAPGQVRSILEILARAETTATGPLPPLLAMPDARPPAGATLLLVTTMLDRALLQALHPRHRAGRPVAVLHVAQQHRPMQAAPFPILRAMIQAGPNAMRSFSKPDVLTPIGQALGEAICLYAYVLVLTPPGAAHAGFGSFAALFVAAAGIGRSAHIHRRNRGPNPWLLVPASILLPPVWLAVLLLPAGGWQPLAWMQRWHMLLAEHAVSSGELFVVTVLVLGIWCRGVWLGLAPAGPDAIERRLIGGLAALLALFFLLAISKGTGVERFTATLRWLLLGWFVIAPCMLALAHLRARHGRSSAVWIVTLATPIGLMTLAGVMLSVGVAPLARHVLHALAATALLLWNAVAYVVYWPVMLLAWLVSLLLPNGVPLVRPDDAPSLPPPDGMDLHGEHPGIAADLVFGALIAGAIVLAAVLLRRLLSNARLANTASDGAEERSSAWSWALLRRQLRALWRRLYELRRRRADHGAGIHRDSDMPQERAAFAADIRALYRALLRWAAAQGHPRPAATTPAELAHRLAASRPDMAAPVALITRQYELARYGERPVSADALALSRDAAQVLAQAAAPPGIGAQRPS